MTPPPFQDPSRAAPHQVRVAGGKRKAVGKVDQLSGTVGPGAVLNVENASVVRNLTLESRAVLDVGAPGRYSEPTSLSTGVTLFNDAEVRSDILSVDAPIRVRFEHAEPRTALWHSRKSPKLSAFKLCVTHADIVEPSEDRELHDIALYAKRFSNAVIGAGVRGSSVRLPVLNENIRLFYWDMISVGTADVKDPGQRYALSSLLCRRFEAAGRLSGLEVCANQVIAGALGGRVSLGPTSPWYWEEPRAINVVTGEGCDPVMFAVAQVSAGVVEPGSYLEFGNCDVAIGEGGIGSNAQLRARPAPPSSGLPFRSTVTVDGAIGSGVSIAADEIHLLHIPPPRTRLVGRVFIRGQRCENLESVEE